MKRLFCAVLLCALLTAFFPARAASRPFTRTSSDYFGTVSMLCLYSDEGAEEIWREVKDLLESIDETVSVSRPGSDIARLNEAEAGTAVPVSALTADIWQRAREAHELTGGLYDPTVFPLVDLWGFSPRFNQKAYQPSLPYDRPLKDGQPVPPAGEDVAALLPLVGMEGFVLLEQGGQWLIRKDTPAVAVAGTPVRAQADLGGIAKGYACDRVSALLREKGITEGYFVCGGSSIVFLSRPEGGSFSVAAGKPRPGKNEGNDYASFSARDTALSTSSDISHSYRGEDGRLYCHIIDPRTGCPLNAAEAEGAQTGAASVTLLSESAALGDALTTALCLMGPGEALSFLSGREEKMVMAVCSAGREEIEVVTNLGWDQLSILDEAYVPASTRGKDGEFRYTGY